MRQIDELNELARPYALALVTALKNEGKLSSSQVESAFKHVPRHPFIDHFFLLETRDRTMQWRHVQPSSVADADVWLRAIYSNRPVITAYDEYNTPTSSSSSPDAMAFMLEAAQLHPGLRVLEIGTGTGYNAALLAHILGGPRHVFTVEIDPALAQRAQHRLDQVAGEGITVHAGNGLHGLAAGAPYARIIATGSYHKVPLAWLDQLQTGGIIVMNLRGHLGAGAFVKVVKVGPRRAAYGTFLAGSDFMELQDSDTPSRNVTDLVSQYAGRAVTAQAPCTQSDFDPSLLWDHRLEFLLQLSFPQMYFTSIGLNPMSPCLIDLESDTMLVFRPTGQTGEWIVEIRGQPHTWQKLARVYRLWAETGVPDVSAYLLDIDDAGQQSVTLASKDGQRVHTWTLHQGMCLDRQAHGKQY
jgi:protein-L-isoaspartate(D-aspartate) O-methyltransferase